MMSHQHPFYSDSAGSTSQHPQAPQLEEEEEELPQDEPNNPKLAQNAAYNTFKFGDIGSYMKNKRLKVQLQHSQFLSNNSSTDSSSPSTSATSTVFSSLVFHINGHTTPPLAELTRLILLNGGKVLPYLDGKTLITHIVAGSLTPKKIVEFKDYKVVSTEFVLDSIREGRLLDWKAYRVGRVLPGGMGERERLVKHGEQVSTREKDFTEENHRLWGNSTSQRSLMDFQRKRKAEDAQSSSTSKRAASIRDSKPPKPAPMAGKPNLMKSGLPTRTSMGPPSLPKLSKEVGTPSKASNSTPSTAIYASNSTSRSSTSTPLSNSSSAPLSISKPDSISKPGSLPSFSNKATTSPPVVVTTNAPRTPPKQSYTTSATNSLASNLLSSPTWRSKHTAVDSSFLANYFGNSRLHHLSLWKAQMKDLVGNVLKESGREEGSPNLKRGMVRVILHIDFDSYFVNVGLRDKPHLRDKPVVVCHVKTPSSSANPTSSTDRPAIISPPRSKNKDREAERSGLSSTSEIASCNYVARSFGIKNGMSLGQARRILLERVHEIERERAQLKVQLRGKEASTEEISEEEPLPATIETIPYDFQSYEQISIEFYRILLENSDAIEAVSIDEALIDVSFMLRDFQKSSIASSSSLASTSRQGQDATNQNLTLVISPSSKSGSSFTSSSNTSSDAHPTSLLSRYLSKVSEPKNVTPEKVLAESLRDEIRDRTGCEASIGIASNVLLARLATRRAKPGGSFHLLDSQKEEFLKDLEVDDLHGIGWHLKQKIKEAYGTSIIGELKAVPRFNERGLAAFLGSKIGPTLWNKCHGIARSELTGPPERQSVGASINYGIRFENEAEAKTFVSRVSSEVSTRLKSLDLKGRKIIVTLMVRSAGAPVEAPKFMGHGKCDTHHKSAEISGKDGTKEATDDEKRIQSSAWKLLMSIGAKVQDMRGFGISLQQLEPAGGRVVRETLLQGQQLLNFAVAPSPALITNPHPPIPPPPPASKEAPHSHSNPQLAQIQSRPAVTTVTSKNDGSSLVPAGLKNQDSESAWPSSKELRAGTSSARPLRRSPSPISEDEDEEDAGEEEAVLVSAPSAVRRPEVVPAPPADLNPSRASIAQPPIQPSQFPRGTMGGQLLLPPESQFDPSVLEALPPRIQAELRAGMKRRSSEPPLDERAQSESPKRKKKNLEKKQRQGRLNFSPVRGEFRLGRSSRSASIDQDPESESSPLRSKSKSKSKVSPSREKSPSLPELEDSVLSSLGISLSVFTELPSDLRRDSIVAEAQRDEAFYDLLPIEWKKLIPVNNLPLNKKKKLMEERKRKLNSDKKVVEDISMAEMSRRTTKSTSLHYLNNKVGVLGNRGKGKGKAIELDGDDYSILKAKRFEMDATSSEQQPHLKDVSSLPEMRSLISNWVKSFSKEKSTLDPKLNKKGPRSGDVNRIVNFLLESLGVKSGERTEGARLGTPRMDLEKVKGILKWWREVLRKDWRGDEMDYQQEHDEMDLDEDLEVLISDWEELDRSISLGRIWWSAFYHAKRMVDQRVVEMTGCQLLL